MNINNLNLTSFIRTAEAGSFNRAAEELFITSAALIKQINQLENDIGVRLFDRTHRGLTLTKAGVSLYKDAKYITGFCEEAVLRARNAMLEADKVVRIGTSPMMPAQMLMDLWPRIHEYCNDVSFKLVPFENTQDNAVEILKNLGQNIDVVTGFPDELLMKNRNCQRLVITWEPICCAVSIYDPLASKDSLAVEDLYGRSLLMAKRGWCRNMDELRRDLRENHPQIEIEDFDYYSIDIFNQCEQRRDILTVIKSWNVVHPLLKVIPVRWEHKMPVGILYSPEPSETVARFMEALGKVLAENPQL